MYNYGQTSILISALIKLLKVFKDKGCSPREQNKVHKYVVINDCVNILMDKGCSPMLLLFVEEEGKVIILNSVCYGHPYS